MNAGQDREARRREQTNARRKSGRAAAVRARKKRQRTIMRVTGLGVGAVVLLAVVLVVVSISKGDTMFYPPDLIDRELERVFKTIHSKKCNYQGFPNIVDITLD